MKRLRGGPKESISAAKRSRAQKNIYGGYKSGLMPGTETDMTVFDSIEELAAMFKREGGAS